MNLVIHTPELGEINWSKWLCLEDIKTSSRENIQKTYSAPTLNWEYIYEYVKTILKMIKESGVLLNCLNICLLILMSNLEPHK